MAYVFSMVGVLCGLFNFSMGLPDAHAKSIHEMPSFEEFVEVTSSYWIELREREIKAPQDSSPRWRLSNSKGWKGFQNLSRLFLGQDRFSLDNIFYKRQEMLAAGDPRFDGGKSTVPLSDAIQVIRGPFGDVIIDGNHDYLLALYLRGKTLPVHVVEDYSYLSPFEFWERLVQENRILFRASPFELVRDLTVEGALFKRLVDVPNRYLASLLSLKVATQPESGPDKKSPIKAVKGPKDPVWIKVNDGVNFMEFFIADVLTRTGIEYDSRWGQNIPKKVVEAAREALIRAHFYRRVTQLIGLIVIGDRKEAKVLRQDEGALITYLRARGQLRSCQSAFTGF